MSRDIHSITALRIELNDRRVGVLTRLDGDRHLFAFDQAYIDAPDRPTLSLSYKGSSGGIVSDARPVQRRLPPFFANLLPEGHLRDYLAAQVGVNAEREFFLLAALGADLPGAVRVTPLTDGTPAPLSAIEEGEGRGASSGALRFSLAGVQLKFSALLEASGGLTIPTRGIGGSWIVKLPSARFPAVPENEHAMLALARAVGIHVPPHRLVALETIQGLPAEAARMGGMALAVERFDRRPDGGRIHMEDFAQVFATYPGDKYKGRSYGNIAAVLRAEAGEESADAFVRRLAFSVAIGNADMHLKNWSLLYPDSRTAVLSPAYDLVSTIPYLPDDQLALTFGRERSLTTITMDQLRRFADTARMSVTAVQALVSETLERTREAWPALAEREGLPEEIQAAISRHMDVVSFLEIKK